MKKGRIVILSGPSGAGKTTLYKKLFKSNRLKKILVKSISVTTRDKREGERNGQEYIFISKKMFLFKKRAGHFLESQKVFNDYYGTPNKKVQELLKKGKNVLLCIEVKGSRVVWLKNPDALKIFIKTPSFRALSKRLKKRATENVKDLEIRLRTAKKELKEARHYDFIIINDNLSLAYRKLEDILFKHLLM